MLKGLVYALVSAAGFGSIGILVKLGFQAGMTGDVMMQLRFSYAVLIMAVLIFIKDRSQLLISRSGLLRCAFIGVVVYWLQTTLLVESLALIPASTAILTLYVHPVVVTLLSWVFLKMRMDKYVAASLALVMGGCCLVFYDAFLREVNATGLLLAVGAMVCFSVYLILVQVLLKGLKPLTATLYVMLFAGAAFTVSGDPAAWLTQTGETFAIGMALGVLGGVVAVTFLYLAIEEIGSAYACIFSSIEPVVALIGAAMFLDETIVLLQMGGAALIIAGIVLPNARNLTLANQTFRKD